VGEKIRKNYRNILNRGGLRKRRNRSQIYRKRLERLLSTTKSLKRRRRERNRRENHGRRKPEGDLSHSNLRGGRVINLAARRKKKVEIKERDDERKNS